MLTQIQIDNYNFNLEKSNLQIDCLIIKKKK